MPESSTASQLVERAFGLARQSGKLEWWSMAIPVLKNRLLLLTNKTFREADFGATSFRDFLNKIPDTVRVDDNSPPGFVILRSAAPERYERSSQSAFRGERIRPDLWRAVLDYSSGRKYLWDTSRHSVSLSTSDEGGLVLPTVSLAELDDWRKEFVDSHKPADEEASRLVEEWRKGRLPTVRLPAQLRPVWNNYLKRKIEQRLQNWFESKSIEAPEIKEERAEPILAGSQVEALREFVLACIRIMSKQELLELRISPMTAMRARRQKLSDE